MQEKSQNPPSSEIKEIDISMFSRSVGAPPTPYPWRTVCTLLKMSTTVNHPERLSELTLFFGVSGGCRAGKQAECCYIRIIALIIIIILYLHRVIQSAINLAMLSREALIKLSI